MDAKQILKFFSEKTGFSLKTIAETPIAHFPATDLITLIETLDKNTNRYLCRGIRRDIIWLDQYNFNFGDLANFYAGLTGRVAEVYYLSPGEEELADVKLIAQASLLENFEKKEDSEPITGETRFLELTYEDLFTAEDLVYFVENQMNLMLPINLGLEKNSTLDDVLGLFTNAYSKMWMKA